MSIFYRLNTRHVSLNPQISALPSHYDKLHVDATVDYAVDSPTSAEVNASSNLEAFTTSPVTSALPSSLISSSSNPSRRAEPSLQQTLTARLSFTLSKPVACTEIIATFRGIESVTIANYAQNNSQMMNGPSRRTFSETLCRKEWSLWTGSELQSNQPYAFDFTTTLDPDGPATTKGQNAAIIYLIDIRLRCPNTGSKFQRLLSSSSPFHPTLTATKEVTIPWTRRAQIPANLVDYQQMSDEMLATSMYDQEDQTSSSAFSPCSDDSSSAPPLSRSLSRSLSHRPLMSTETFNIPGDIVLDISIPRATVKGHDLLIEYKTTCPYPASLEWSLLQFSTFRVQSTTPYPASVTERKVIARGNTSDLHSVLQIPLANSVKGRMITGHVNIQHALKLTWHKIEIKPKPQGFAQHLSELLAPHSTDPLPQLSLDVPIYCKNVQEELSLLPPYDAMHLPSYDESESSTPSLATPQGSLTPCLSTRSASSRSLVSMEADVRAPYISSCGPMDPPTYTPSAYPYADCTV